MLTEMIAPLFGALIGLALGWIDYKIIKAVLVKKLRQTDQSKTPEEKADFEKRLVWLDRLLLASTLGTFPIIGFLLGRTLGW